MDLSNTPSFPEAPPELAALSLQPHPHAAADAPTGTELVLLSATPQPEKSNLHAVGYFCAWDPELRGPVLRRQTASAAETAGALRSLPRAAPFHFPWTLLPRDVPGEPLARCVWDLRVLIPGPGPADPPVSADGLRFNRELPAWVEVRFKAVSPSALPPDRPAAWSPKIWTDGPLPWGPLPIQKALCRNAREFATRIHMAR